MPAIAGSASALEGAAPAWLTHRRGGADPQPGADAPVPIRRAARHRKMSVGQAPASRRAGGPSRTAHRSRRRRCRAGQTQGRARTGSLRCGPHAEPRLPGVAVVARLPRKRRPPAGRADSHDRRRRPLASRLRDAAHGPQAVVCAPATDVPSTGPLAIEARSHGRGLTRHRPRAVDRERSHERPPPVPLRPIRSRLPQATIRGAGPRQAATCRANANRGASPIAAPSAAAPIVSQRASTGANGPVTAIRASGGTRVALGSSFARPRPPTRRPPLPAPLPNAPRCPRIACDAALR